MNLISLQLAHQHPENDLLGHFGLLLFINVPGVCSCRWQSAYITVKHPAIQSQRLQSCRY